MSVVISGDLVLTDTESGGGTITADNPLIGYENRVTASNISATSAADGFPAANLANPSTNLRWKGSPASPPEDDYLTADLQTEELVDYLAIARHNFGSAEIPVSVEVEDDTVSPPEWNEVISETLLGDDSPALFRFTPQGISQIRLRLQPGTEAPACAVMYTGKLLVVQRKLYVGHTPIKYGRETNVVNGRSEAGHFLGRIVTGQRTGTQAAFQNLRPAWYRDNIEPFLADAQENPFFWAWRPSSYPREVGFAWLTNDPQPENQGADGRMQVTFEMAGVV